LLDWSAIRLCIVPEVKTAFVPSEHLDGPSVVIAGET